MSWKDRRWAERAPRPKVKRLSKREKEEVLTVLREGIEASPVLSALDIRARSKLKSRDKSKQILVTFSVLNP